MKRTTATQPKKHPKYGKSVSLPLIVRKVLDLESWKVGLITFYPVLGVKGRVSHVIRGIFWFVCWTHISRIVLELLGRSF